MPDGIHHVTMITRRAQANVDFYAGFLGLRLVKRTAGFEDAEQLHLFYGDAIGSPGSLVTFLAWEDGSPGRAGLGQAIDLALAIGPENIGFWLTRCLRFGVGHQMPTREFGEPVLAMTDPDGITVKLVATDRAAGGVTWTAADIPPEHAVKRIRGATILSDRPDATADVLARWFGYRLSDTEGNTRRFASGSDVIDVRDGTGFWPGAPGTGIIDHIAFRAPDVAAVAALRGVVEAEGRTVTGIKDRCYFSSLYAREPAGALLEYATEGPGMLVDESREKLGTQLFVPPEDSDRVEDIQILLPQIALPGEERDMHPDLPFIHRLYRPDEPDGSALVLLHGTGGNETDLFPIGRNVAPRAALLGVRGRSTEEGILRWFRRLTATTFDQTDVTSEAEAFAAFVRDIFRIYGFDPLRTTFLGYSNGANFIAAFMLLHPHIIRRAALLRPMLVLDSPPEADLSDAAALTVAGRSDPYGGFAPALEKILRDSRARLDRRTVDAGHELVPDDIAAVQEWLSTETAREQPRANPGGG